MHVAGHKPRLSFVTEGDIVVLINFLFFYFSLSGAAIATAIVGAGCTQDYLDVSCLISLKIKIMIPIPIGTKLLFP